ncbi:hypothetical protein JOB18_040832 [Solea senegalensis]|uniref:Uncharacterized protein n=1 Tax=Solea senegalensis TaxID=28829 RepID=A0AAV6RE09_SOLSE|nr:hypothetical protein JOB18_040832 [Solea senegalensis]
MEMASRSIIHPSHKHRTGVDRLHRTPGGRKSEAKLAREVLGESGGYCELLRFTSRPRNTSVRVGEMQCFWNNAERNQFSKFTVRDRPPTAVQYILGYDERHQRCSSVEWVQLMNGSSTAKVCL